jgi:regulatory protein
VADALEGLSSSGLIDDERFARALAEQTVVVRGSGRRAALEALRAKGVARDVAERAVEGAAGEDEEARAEDLARRRATRLTGLDPARAGRRLLEFLIRRGYEPAVARRAAARALGEHVSAD